MLSEGVSLTQVLIRIASSSSLLCRIMCHCPRSGSQISNEISCCSDPITGKPAETCKFQTCFSFAHDGKKFLSHHAMDMLDQWKFEQKLTTNQIGSQVKQLFFSNQFCCHLRRELIALSLLARVRKNTQLISLNWTI